MPEKKPKKIPKFVVGDRIKFVTSTSSGFYTIDDPYYTDDPALGSIPTELIKHGSTQLKKNEGVVVATYKSYYIVRYTDVNGTKVQLGFKEGRLKHFPKKGTLQEVLKKIREEING